MKTRVRRTELTIEFEQVYRGPKATSFQPCSTCDHSNARIPLADAIWLLRGVLGRFERLLFSNADSQVCLFCMCSRAIENTNEKEQDI